ncbi:MAG: CheR family methyltransferase [Elusimicrobiota bacterium]
MELTESEFKLFQEFISKNSGLNFDESTKLSLKISLLARIRHKGFEDYSQYYKYIRFHPNGATEFRDLLTLLTINETSFFRNPEQFRGLKKFIIPEILKDNQEKNIKIWSAGCATGEEPYSIAICLLEILHDTKSWNIEILGTDIDKQALSGAKEGIYKQRSLRLTNKKYIEKYFKEDNGRFRLNDNIKDMVSFDYSNLSNTAMYPSPLTGRWDIIFCRNVLIYFKKELVEQIIAKFYREIRDSGYFLVGYSEMLTAYKQDFKAVKYGDLFIYKKEVKPEEPLVPDKDITKEKPDYIYEIQQEAMAERRSPDSSYNKALELFIKEDFDGALKEVKEAIENYPLNSDAHILTARIYFERGVYDEAEKAAKKAIYLDADLAPAHYLLGILYEKLGFREKAVAELELAIKLSPYFPMAFFHLGNLLFSGNKHGALEAYRNAIIACSNLSSDDYLEFAGGFNCGLLTALCRTKIQEIERQSL